MIVEHKGDPVVFRAALREWLARVVPADWSRKMLRASSDEFVVFQRWWMEERRKVGMATPHWPAEFGGADLRLAHEIIIADEFARANAPPVTLYIVSLNHIPATLLQWGTQKQKDRYLPGVARGEIWCQGFSEPSAGSDLAALRTRAVRDGDNYIVNGQKIWSSYSMYADYCILLTRTDFQASKHRGISYFILDMRAPGVEVRPIRQANGHARFGEIFLTDVVIPAANLVGAENDGWTVAQSTLAAERGILSFERAERRGYAIAALVAEAAADPQSWWREPALRAEFMQIFAEAQASRRLARALLAEKGGGVPLSKMTAAYMKLTSTSLMQRIGDFLVRAHGISAQVDPTGEGTASEGMREYLQSFGETIAAGSNEIMRNLIAERDLGLPR
ncbi:acyl-CoA dehydrogenase [Sphingopyxis lindanitolerans]|uniref:Acyl-CoA dehydrogenase n=1 Tax=Sphingopyxis lindanitolerans TaxID=2054227 RepID=A0A2S8BAP0_9SPHN|nr:acyl-CoA dehydrogenase family protein [Sphingopyxis lindanitolerans]PQM29485.1 acyl-CoA dehydrogenase [Sphingopyxis lindanitolerans]